MNENHFLTKKEKFLMLYGGMTLPILIVLFPISAFIRGWGYEILSIFLVVFVVLVLTILTMKIAYMEEKQ